MKKVTREQWLNQMVEYFKPDFKRAGFPLTGKKIRVGVGFPSSRGTTSNHRTIGECWSRINSSDGTYEIILSVTISDSVKVVSTLIHELAHVALDGFGVDANGKPMTLAQHGHGKWFRKLALQVGLSGQMRSTVASDKLRETIETLVVVNGTYPHAELNISTRKKQPTRLHKVVCPDCGYTVRVARSWLEQGTPTCVCGIKMQECI